MRQELASLVWLWFANCPISPGATCCATLSSQDWEGGMPQLTEILLMMQIICTILRTHSSPAVTVKRLLKLVTRRHPAGQLSVRNFHMLSCILNMCNFKTNCYCWVSQGEKQLPLPCLWAQLCSQSRTEPWHSELWSLSLAVRTDPGLTTKIILILL